MPLTARIYLYCDAKLGLERPPLSFVMKLRHWNKRSDFCMEEQKPYSDRDLKRAKDSIDHAKGYKDVGLEALVEGLNLSPTEVEDFRGKRILDLGAGAHLQFARGLEKAGINADVVSLSPAFADKYWREAMKGRKESDMLVAAMGEQLPFADESFDRIVSDDVLEHLHTHKRYILFLKEVVRVLAPKGLAYLGPAAEISGEYAANVIAKPELEKLLDHQATATWRLSHKILKYFTLILEKNAHVED